MARTTLFPTKCPFDVHFRASTVCALLCAAKLKTATLVEFTLVMPLIISYASRTASRRRSASTGLGDLLHEADSGARREFLPRIHPRRLSARQAKRRSRPWIETVRKVCGINTMTLPARLETSSDLQQERPRWGSNPGPMVNAGRFLLASAFRVHAGQPAFTRPLPLCQKTDTDRGRHGAPPPSPRKGNSPLTHHYESSSHCNAVLQLHHQTYTSTTVFSQAASVLKMVSHYRAN